MHLHLYHLITASHQVNGTGRWWKRFTVLAALSLTISLIRFKGRVINRFSTSKGCSHAYSSAAVLSTQLDRLGFWVVVVMVEQGIPLSD